MQFKRGLFYFMALSLILGSQANAKQRKFKRRLIVKYKQNQFEALSAKRKKRLRVVELKDGESFNQLKENYELDQNVEYVEEDVLLQPQANDPLFTSQWHYTDFTSGINLENAWSISTGSSSNIVAVVDTGILANHPDISSKILPGADLISETSVSNDGDGRDTDPSDAGDWVDSSDFCYQGQFKPSTWHGTHVAGTVAATTNNGIGVAGVNPNARILPVRVLGQCGGFTSDIADGVRWAAGGSVSGVPDNANPAKVINLSLGGPGICSQTMQSAIDFAISQGAVVVVAAGNSNSNIDFNSFTPANCAGVIRVAAVDRNGDRASYSNFGNGVHVSAPGGGSTFSVFSLSNTGVTTPLVNTYKGQSGTSMAAPHVSAIASLIFDVNPNLFPSQVIQIIRDTTKNFPSSTSCFSEGGCGNGIVDAFDALNEALTALPDSSVPNTQPITGGSPTETVELAQSRDQGFGCATIDTSGGSGGGKGPFSMTLLMFMLYSLKTLRRDSKVF